MRQLLEDAAELVDGALHVLHSCRPARQVGVLPHHHLLLLLQQRLPAHCGGPSIRTVHAFPFCALSKAAAGIFFKGSGQGNPNKVMTVNGVSV